MYYYKIVIAAIFLLSPLVSVNGTESRPLESILELESNLKIATNNDGYLVIKKSDWENSKSLLLKDWSDMALKRDSLSVLVNLQSDSLVLYKNINTQDEIVVEGSSNKTILLKLIIILMSLILLILVFKIAQKRRQYEEDILQYQNIEEQYKNSKIYWIDQERKLKRQLIDTREELNNLISLSKKSPSSKDLTKKNDI